MSVKVNGVEYKGVTGFLIETLVAIFVIPMVVLVPLFAVLVLLSPLLILGLLVWAGVTLL